MLPRCKKEIAQSYSADGGKTWQPQSTAFPHVNSKAVIRRMQSGNLLVIRHGQDITKTTPKRQELTSFLLFPGRHLHGVHVELLDILLHRLEPFEGFQSHAGS
jgi:hypothetical protein